MSAIDRWEVRTHGEDWQESTFGATLDEALGAVYEPAYPYLHIEYVFDRGTDTYWVVGFPFPWRDHETRRLATALD
jgi:hypothetical protein